MWMIGRLPRSSRRNSAVASRAGALAAFALMASAACRPAAPAKPAGVPAARDVVADAVKTAQAGGRVVLVEFGASWCVWCRSFDAFVHAPETSSVVHDNFVVVNLTVQERGDKKALENPGGEQMMTDWDGLDAGLPFYVFLNASGEKIADSNVMPDGSNVGFPGNAKEIEMFSGLIEATAPHMTPAGRAAIAGYLAKVVKS
jgi:thiol:disulfide interchange protein